MCCFFIVCLTPGSPKFSTCLAYMVLSVIYLSRVQAYPHPSISAIGTGICIRARRCRLAAART